MQRPAPIALCALALLVWPVASGCGSHIDTSPTTASMPGSADGPSQSGNAAGEKRAQDRLHPLAIIHTSLGEITVRLDAEHAPISVDNFLAYVEQGHYDNTLFHQVLAHPALILGGGYDTFQKEKPTGPPIRNEARNGLKNVRGTIGMARRSDSIDSSTSQFYINRADNSQLDSKAKIVASADREELVGRDGNRGLDPSASDAAGYGYCVFGQVTGGMEVVDQIARAPVHDVSRELTSTPVDQVVVKWIHVVR